MALTHNQNNYFSLIWVLPKLNLKVNSARATQILFCLENWKQSLEGTNLGNLKFKQYAEPSTNQNMVSLAQL